jgi:heme exporter protein B
VRSYLRAILAIFWKDFLLEVRAKEVVTPILVFAMLIVVTFNFVFRPEADTVAVIAAGTMWASFTFAGVLGMGRVFALEKERGGLDGLLLAPVTRDVVFLGKMLSILVFMLLVEAAMLPVFGALFGVPVQSPALWLVMALATLGFATVGTVFSAMAVNTRAREVLLPVLFLPLVVPVIIAGVEASGEVFRGDGLEGYPRWLGLIAGFDGVFLVASAALFQFTVQE